MKRMPWRSWNIIPICCLGRKISQPQDNWDPKPDNIRKMAEELNLGTDSFVFFDDSEAEREMVRQMLPEVTVPDFPARPEELAPCMAKIYEEYFARAVITKEDWEKTAQYRPMPAEMPWQSRR